MARTKLKAVCIFIAVHSLSVSIPQWTSLCQTVTMTAPMYLGAALCYDQANVALYENACKSVNELGNAWQYQGVEFDCTGILMNSFYNLLVAGGETNACVCSFLNTGSWTFQQSWGPCNGACTQPYNCDGLTPVIADNSNTGDSSSPATAFSAGRSTPTSASIGGVSSSPTSFPTSSPTSSVSSESSTTPTSLAVPLAISWKALLCVATTMLFSTVI